MTILGERVREVGRAAIERWLPCLDAWLLPGSFYGVRHTWPLLYRSDGHGRFFVLTEGEHLLAHCATRVGTMHGEAGPREVCLLGSVATDPARRGRGLASHVLAAAVRAHATSTAATLLWAERPELYARAGFVAGPDETCVLLARRPHSPIAGVRAATIADHAQLHALHARKPWRMARSPQVMATLLTTPGMTTLVRERAGEVVAYACTGKGADLQGYWHELGGDDDDLAILLPAALHVAQQATAFLLLPPYRPRLRELLAHHVVDTVRVSGPMVRTNSPEALGACWIDGLDSV